jgi:hypothetical protein
MVNPASYVGEVATGIGYAISDTVYSAATDIFTSPKGLINGGAGGYRILLVQPGSPAEAVNLSAYDDVIVGAAGNEYLDPTNITSQSAIATVIGKHEDQKLRLKVHNSKTGVEREVVISPRRGWSGGQGLVGIKIRYDPLDPTAVDLGV